MDNEQTITPRALEKMSYDGIYLMFPKDVYTMTLPLADMADGLGGYHSCKTLADIMSPKWQPIFKTINGHEYFFIHYCITQNKTEQTALRDYVENLGLVNCLLDIQAEDLDINVFNGNEYCIMSKRDKVIVDNKISETEDETVSNA